MDRMHGKIFLALIGRGSSILVHTQFGFSML